MPPTDSSLTVKDYRALSERWISHDWAEAAGIERKDNFSASELVGGDARKRNHEGLWIPYRLPEGVAEAIGALGGVYGGRLRRDHPEVTVSPRGVRKQKNKYLAATGDRNHLYFPPSLKAAWLKDKKLPLLLVEGEFKTIAARRLATHNAVEPRFLPVGLTGAWNWQGKIGKHTDEDGERVDEYGTIPDWNYLALRGRRVIIALDADLKTNPKIKAALYQLSAFLISEGAAVANLSWELKAPDGREAKGLDDWLYRDGPEPVLSAINELEYRDGLNWRTRLITTATGAPKPLLENARLALAESEEWTGTLIYDNFLQRLQATRKPWIGGKPGVWERNDDIQLACWLQRQGIEVGKEIAGDAVRAAAPTRDMAAEWLQSLQWDGTPRVDNWLAHYMGARVNRDGVDITNYVSAVGAAWLIGGVARLLDPGCQMDYCLVLFGTEGRYKSSALKVLANGWFMDSLKDITSPFAPTLLAGKWIIEFPELQGWKKAEKEDLKAFISRRIDSFRGPYDRDSQDHARRCIFAGTTNEPTFLDDDGGQDRRFWPIHVIREILLEQLRQDCQQLWAEARTMYEDGRRPMLAAEAEKLANVERENYKESDIWHPAVHTYISRRAESFDGENPITTQEIATSGLKLEGHQLNHSVKLRISKIMRSLKYEVYRHGSQRIAAWRKVEE